MAEPLYSTADLLHSEEDDPLFDREDADRAVAFFSLLRHSQGEFAGKRFELMDWQERIVRDVFGRKREDGTRRFRTVYLEVGRGNGKSQFAAALAGYLLFADREPEAEVIGAAADREQARICLKRLQSMVEQSPSLAKLAQHYRKELRVPKTRSTYTAVSADARGNWGANPSGVVFDEIHAQPNRELWDALVTATGKRRQPLIVAITTAGWERESLCWQLHEYTREIAEGVIEDQGFYGVVYAAAEDDDWTDPETWKRANPAMGTIFSEEFIEGECAKAKSVPAFQNSFRTAYLSQWVGQESRFIDMAAWDACQEEPTEPSGQTAYAGLDLASTTDLAAFVVVTENDDKLDIYPHVFVPEGGLRARERRDRAPYEDWARAGLLTVTPGPVIDYAYIRQAILEANQTFDLHSIAYDRWNALQLVGELEDEGLTMAPMGQGVVSMSAPTKELVRLVMEGKLRHGGNPLMRWTVNNVAAKVDEAGNVKPDKKRSSGRIDPVVALVMALDIWSRFGRDNKPVSVYAKRAMEVAT